MTATIDCTLLLEEADAVMTADAEDLLEQLYLGDFSHGTSF